VLVDGVHIIYQDTRPDALVGGLVAFGTEGHLGGALATATLTVLAQEDLTFAGGDSAEVGRIAPVPSLLPAELLESRKALFKVGDVQDGS